MPTQPSVKYFLAASDPKGESPRMTITTNAADREGDRVVPEGGQFANFLKNPVLCWVHDYKHIPIGRVTELQVSPGKGIDATWAWLENDEFAARVKNAYEQGCINASSIGFIPLESSPNGKGHDITAWEMLELTLCPIPMNPEAVRAMKSLGFGEQKTKEDPRVTLRAKAAILKMSAAEKSYEFSCGLSAMGCVESLLSMESEEPDQAANLMQAAQLLLTYLSQEFAECYGTTVSGTKDDDGIDQNAQLDEPLIPMDDDSKYPFVSATGLTGDAKLALVKGINAAFSTRVSQKKGRRLSAANEAKLQNAHAHIGAAQDTVKEVLDCMKDQAGPIVGEHDDDEGGDASGMMALSIDDGDDFVLELSDTPRLTMDLKNVDDMLDVDPVALQAALRDVIGATLREHVSEAMQTAVDRARGRVVA